MFMLFQIQICSSVKTRRTFISTRKEKTKIINKLTKFKKQILMITLINSSNKFFEIHNIHINV